MSHLVRVPATLSLIVAACGAPAARGGSSSAGATITPVIDIGDLLDGLLRRRNK